MSTREFVDTRIYKQFKTKLFTNILAKVISVDHYEEWGMINVRPCIADVWEEDGSAMSFPIVTNVPVMIYSGGGAVVTVPIAVGDTVTLQVNMRNIDSWKQGIEEDVNVPIDSRMFDLTDSIAFPCVYSKATTVTPNPDDLELRYNDSIVRLKKNGDITIDTAGNIYATVAGNVEAEVGGDMKVHVEGDADISIEGNSTSSVGGDSTSIVEGTLNITSGQDTFLTTTGLTRISSTENIIIQSGDNITLGAAGNITILYAQNISLANSGTFTLTSSGNVNVSAPTVNLSATTTNLGVGGQPIARVGDSVQVEVTSGSSSGTWVGTITSGGNNTSI